QMNQLYLINERILKDEGISLGGRVDLLYGTDFIYTVAGGFDDGWNTGRYYGLAMAPPYWESGKQNPKVKVG
ncbi:MAG TPA: porin, partial [Planctomycetaceae bacterium]|nr:porin [Planctomycetaceae bacterium]